VLVSALKELATLAIKGLATAVLGLMVIIVVYALWGPDAIGLLALGLVVGFWVLERVTGRRWGSGRPTGPYVPTDSSSFSDSSGFGSDGGAACDSSGDGGGGGCDGGGGGY
jgi:uncharacterized membrane protein YgcG